jgi:hypothetical protein
LQIATSLRYGIHPHAKATGHSAYLSVIREHLDHKVPIILMGLKNDLTQKTKDNAIQEFKTGHDLKSYQTASALTGNGVEEAYSSLVKAISAVYWESRNQI